MVQHLLTTGSLILCMYYSTIGRKLFHSLANVWEVVEWYDEDPTLLAHDKDWTINFGLNSLKDAPDLSQAQPFWVKHSLLSQVQPFELHILSDGAVNLSKAQTTLGLGQVQPDAQQPLISSQFE